MKTNDFQMQKGTRVGRKTARYARRIAVMLVVAALLATNWMSRVEAADGDLDPTFGDGGKVMTSFVPGGGIGHIAIQADGKIVVVGSAMDSNGEQFRIARYNPSGSLDTTFGNGGSVITDFQVTYASAGSVAIQTDGKIVVSGDASLEWGLLARYNTDGSLDETFGTGGKVIVSFTGVQLLLTYLTIQSNGRIVAVGWTYHPSQSNPNAFDLAVLRVNANGTLDTSFGAGGLAQIDIAQGDEFAYDVAIQPDGKILACGRYVSDPTANQIGDFLLVRLNANGSLDTTFGTGGKVTTDFFDFYSSRGYAQSIALLPDGRILLCGAVFTQDQSNQYHKTFALAQYNPDGSLDTGFGTGGKSAHYFPGANNFPIFLEYGFLAVLPSGKITVLGAGGDYPNRDFALARYNADGSVDTGFGNNGLATTDYSMDDGGIAIARYGKDQIVAAGYAYNTQSSMSSFALARYQGEGAPQSANLGVQMSASPSGNTITYTITVNNYGPDPSYYVTLKDTVPTNTTFVSFTAPSGWVVYAKPGLGQTGTISVSKTQMVEPHPPLILSATFTLVVRVGGAASGTTISNRAYVSSSFTPDPYAANNKAIVYNSVP